MRRGRGTRTRTSTRGRGDEDEHEGRGRARGDEAKRRKFQLFANLSTSGRRGLAAQEASTLNRSPGLRVHQHLDQVWQSDPLMHWVTLQIGAIGEQDLL